MKINWQFIPRCVFIWDTKKIIPHRSDFIKNKKTDFLNELVKNIKIRIQFEVLASLRIGPIGDSDVGDNIRGLIANGSFKMCVALSM